ncbi:hypothetical protein B0H66DRAFT_602413 [Apodospora peruviana]|uniref:FAD-binding domain-containing protein n=1 Tax=Apodospora peruviana TaxID=516989 RepID=A0AAE0IEW4_9PEZI|nr:hypothetical protein B0H66DRAFT_602413 [Apodospora peruviana]
MHAIIIGAGPAGLAAALALHKQSNDTPSAPAIRITVLERRPNITLEISGGGQLGGAINLTPLALRYLDALGVGKRLRPRGAKVSSIEMISHRTGTPLGKLWPNVDALRVARQQVVECLAETISESPEISIRHGVRIAKIEQVGDADGKGEVKVHLTSGQGDEENEVIEGDFLLGCDGIHSHVKSTVVDPGRKKEYSGRAAAYGYVRLDEPGETGVMMADGTPAIRDSSMVMGARGTLLMTFFEPSRTRVYVAGVISAPEEEVAAAEDGRKAVGRDKESLKRDMLRRFEGGGFTGLEELVAKCQEWFFFPVYMLPNGGVWSKGRVLLLGDAAHAMPPQGESTGVAIEDGVLLAHVFSRRGNRSVAAMFADYEKLRRDVIKKLYDQTMFRWADAGDKPLWKSVVMDWVMWVVLLVMNYSSKDHFARDVRKLELPA